MRKCAETLQKHCPEQPRQVWWKQQVPPMVPSCLWQKKGPSQVTLLGPSQVPRSSRGALGLESTLPRESSSGPWFISTLDPHLSPSRKIPPDEPELKIWAEGLDASKVNQVFKHVRLPMETEKSDAGKTGFLCSYRHNPGIPPQGLPYSQQRSHGGPGIFVHWFEYSSHRVKVSDLGQMGPRRWGKGETPFSAMILHCCPRGRFMCVSNPWFCTIRHVPACFRNCCWATWGSPSLGNGI